MKKVMIVDTNRDISAKDWLELATTEHAPVPGYGAPHGITATDRVRIHRDIEIGSAGECDCGNDEIHQKIKAILDAEPSTKFIFALDRQFLIDALAGMAGDTIIFRGDS